jgi:hypothetical protein
MIKSGSIILCVLVLFSNPALGQKRKAAPFNKSDEPTEAQVAEEAENFKDLCERLIKATSEVVSSAEDYKTRLQELVTFQENDVETASETVERRKKLLAEKKGDPFYEKSLEESKRTLATAQAKVSDSKGKIDEANKLIAESKDERAKNEAEYANTDWMATARQALRVQNREARLARLARRRASPKMRTDVEIIEIIIRYRVLRTPERRANGKTI